MKNCLTLRLAVVVLLAATGCDPAPPPHNSRLVAPEPGDAAPYELESVSVNGHPGGPEPLTVKIGDTLDVVAVWKILIPKAGPITSSRLEGLALMKNGDEYAMCTSSASDIKRLSDDRFEAHYQCQAVRPPTTVFFRLTVNAGPWPKAVQFDRGRIIVTE